MFPRQGQALLIETAKTLLVGLELALGLSHLPAPLLLPQVMYLPTPLHEVFLKQDLGLEATVAALGFFCQVVEPGVGEALLCTHSGTVERAVW